MLTLYQRAQQGVRRLLDAAQCCVFGLGVAPDEPQGLDHLAGCSGALAAWRRRGARARTRQHHVPGAAAGVDLQIEPGRIEAVVAGSRAQPYDVQIKITPLAATHGSRLKTRCAGEIGSLIELLEGRLSERVMGIVTDPAQGLFPKPGDIGMSCSCPDWATMCKHVAAVLYGVGERLDAEPLGVAHSGGAFSSTLSRNFGERKPGVSTETRTPVSWRASSSRVARVNSVVPRTGSTSTSRSLSSMSVPVSAEPNTRGCLKP